MAFDLLRVKSLKATIAIPVQFVFVNIDTNGGIVLPSAGGYAIGVCQDTPLAGDPAGVCYPGDITKVLASATITAGQDVSTDANGNAIAAVSADYVLGTALTAGANGFLMDIIYQPKGAKGVI